VLVEHQQVHHILVVKVIVDQILFLVQLHLQGVVEVVAILQEHLEVQVEVEQEQMLQYNQEVLVIHLQ
tara:strand:- start:296 stop:499 length:204 start_codon:yes stop_codon:yes gene_type:complete